MFGMPLPDITAAAAAAPPGCGGVSMLPYLSGERTPDWPDARGAILGLTPGALQQPGLLYRAALEGSTVSLASGINLCVSPPPPPASPWHVPKLLQRIAAPFVRCRGRVDMWWCCG